LSNSTDTLCDGDTCRWWIGEGVDGKC
jgi:hypothetical protein